MAAHNYWRSLITADAASQSTTIGQWRIYDSGGSEIATTQGAPSASTINSGEPNDVPACAFDSNTATYWASDGAPSVGTPAWLALQLPITGLPGVRQSRAKANTSSAAFYANVQSGNLLIVVVGDETSVSAATCSDTLGTSYSSAISVTGATNVKIFYGTAPSSGANTATIAGYTSAGWENVGILEIANTQAVLDGTAVGAGSGATSPGSLTTTAANSIVIVGMDGFHNATVWTQPSGWTLTQAGGHDAVGIAYHIQASAGSVSPTFSGTRPIATCKRCVPSRPRLPRTARRAWLRSRSPPEMMAPMRRHPAPSACNRATTGAPGRRCKRTRRLGQARGRHRPLRLPQQVRFLSIPAWTAECDHK